MSLTKGFFRLSVTPPVILDRICTHILAFEGDGEVVFFEGDYSDYEINKARRLGNTEIKKTRYRKLMED